MKSINLITVVFFLIMLVIHSTGWAYGDHDMARQMVLKGEILSLESILEKAKSKYPGRLLEVELEKIMGKWTYEVVFLNQKGQIIELYFDAKTGQYLFSAEEK